MSESEEAQKMSALAPQFDSSSTDRRTERRARAIKSAKLIYGGFSPTVIDCIVHDLSELGACVETEVMVEVPEFLTLRLADNTHHKARRCWARGNHIGLEFAAKA
ncbi:MAG: PilZ domain-containing protein [Acidocella sp.]|uniref:PilZ domain-containing protein n=1 Tax=Acidocella sp. TaxID=50710 RepID=UPI003FC536AD